MKNNSNNNMTKTGRQPGNKRHSVDNERGVALIIALVMLLVLGVLGILSLNTSTTELRITGNYRNDNIAFYNANTLDAYGPNNSVLYSQIATDGGALSTFPSGTIPYQQITSGLPGNALGTTSIRIQYLCVSQAPPGFPSDVKAFHYVVTVVGRGLNNAEFVTESEMIKLLPTDIQTDC